MKTIKPQALGLLTRPFEDGDACYLSISLLAYFPFDVSAGLLPELKLWKFVAQELGRDAALDLGMPKPRGELLVTGKAYPPGGAPSIACRVRARIGTVDKSLAVIGNRVWRRGVASDPEPFTELPLSWENAFGGPGYPLNPLGKGFAPIRGEGGEVHPLPNVEFPGRLIQRPGDRPGPAGFGAYDLTWPQRFSKAGTYDQRWLEERFPGFARDLDWTMFNAAPEDQQVEGFFRGDETFSLEHLHPRKPLLEGQLPGLRTRAFLNRKAGGGEVFEEVSTRLDTVQLFPHAEQGVLIFRGVARVAEDDASDVLQIVVGCEVLGSERSPEHYREVLRQRLDKEKGPLLALNDSDLMPASQPSVGPAALVGADPAMATEGLLGKNLRQRAAREREQARERIRALGLDPDQVGPKPLPPPEPLPDLVNVQALIDKEIASAEQRKAELARQRAQAEQEARQLAAQLGLDFDEIQREAKRRASGPPKFSARRELEKLQALAAEVRARGASAPEVEALLADPELPKRLKSTEEEMLGAYRRMAHQLPAAARLEGDVARNVRESVLESLRSGQSLAGRDLTGADLSGLDLRGAQLPGALLEGANLAGAILAGADLAGAVLARADLTGADLTSARLVGANLGAATLARARADGAELTEAVLAKASLVGASFRGARLDGADLAGAAFDATDFSGVTAHGLVLVRSSLAGLILSGADLTKASFIETEVAGVDFGGATLRSAVFVGCKGDRARFRGARLENLRLVKECSFEGADFAEALLDAANLRGTNLAGCDFTRARLPGADLSECNLKGARLYRAAARDARFAKADLSGAALVSIDLMNGILQKAVIDGADFTGANLFRADFTRARGKAGSLRDANLKQVRIVTRGAHG